MTLHPDLAARFSCRDYRPEPIPDESLRALFEAARWAPSAWNDQPWSFLVARREDPAAFERMLSCFGGNARWASGASVLLACCAVRAIDHDGRPNLHTHHDLGQAVMAMAVQGVPLGLQCREVDGVDRDRLRMLYEVPAPIDVVTGLAIGVPASPMPSGRARKEQREFVFTGRWGNPC